MALREEFASSGLWLFRWRSLLPLLAMALILGLIVLDPHDQPAWAGGHAWLLCCVAVSTLGLIVRIVTVGRVPHDTSRRSTRQQTAAILNRTGMYSVLRHPLYLGNFLMWLGVAMAPGIWWLAALIALAYALYYERIMYSEEEFLRDKFGQEYLDWAEHTPAVLPAFGRWQATTLPFSWRTVLRRENASAFALLVAFTLTGLAQDFVATHPFVPKRERLIAFGIGCAIYLVLRFFKRNTRLLHVDGR